jgi:hypothetical protein
MWPVRNSTPFPCGLGRTEILDIVHQDHAVEIFAIERRKMRKFSREPADLANHSANHDAALGFGPIRKREAQIFFRDVAKRRPQKKQNARDAHADDPRERPRQNPQRFQK